MYGRHYYNKVDYKAIGMRVALILAIIGFIWLFIYYIFFHWNTMPDGRKYRTHYICTMGHNETTIVPVTSIGPNNQVTVTTEVRTNYVCDAGYTDTTWKDTWKQETKTEKDGKKND
jgi:hypothetical protein